MTNKVLRLVFKQSKAHYRKEETLDNKMTYPLPPYSTVIGAIHNACGYKEYHPMDLSIQGSYGSMQKEVYRDLAFLNSVMDDRGILVKKKSPNLLNEGFKVIAKAMKSQGNSFKKRITIDIEDEKELQEFIRIAEMNEIFQNEKKIVDEKIKVLKNDIKSLKEKLKKAEKTSEDYRKINNLITEKTDLTKQLRTDFQERRYNEYEHPYSHYATLTTSIKYYEVLYDVELVVHVRSDEKTIEDIKSNIHSLTAIGRSEDFVELTEIKEVIIDDEFDEDELSFNNEFLGYVDHEAIKCEAIYYSGESSKIDAIPTRGTVYFLNKNYNVMDGKREFEKKIVTLISNYSLSDEAEDYNDKFKDRGLYFDPDGYIINLM